MMVKRYEVDGPNDLHESDTGSLVAFEDYATLTAKVAELEATQLPDGWVAVHKSAMDVMLYERTIKRTGDVPHDLVPVDMGGYRQCSKCGRVASDEIHHNNGIDRGPGHFTIKQPDADAGGGSWQEARDSLKVQKCGCASWTSDGKSWGTICAVHAGPPAADEAKHG
jgi:hypothetical protein